MDYFKILSDTIHSVVVATINEENKPQTRAIDIMLSDDKTVYFLTAKGKSFYRQLVKQPYISLTGTKDKMSISLSGYIKNIGKEKLNEIFEKNTYMQKIYPEGTRDALEVFCFTSAYGEYFDISNPSKIFRESFHIGNVKSNSSFYQINSSCIGCKKCLTSCPQKCIDVNTNPFSIILNQCLHCGECYVVCPANAIERKGN